MDDLTLTVERRVSAPPERVCAAWLDPDMLARFMLAMDDVTVPHAETDPRPGGRFVIMMRSGGRDLPHAGTYLEITPPKRLAFTWVSGHSPDGSTVTVDFAPAGEATDVTLTQVKFFDTDRRDAHRQGWAAILAALDTVLTEPQGVTQ
jgi:uncharacterized protein YndB with AHSA1/START domain